MFLRGMVLGSEIGRVLVFMADFVMISYRFYTQALPQLIAHFQIHLLVQIVVCMFNAALRRLQLDPYRSMLIGLSQVD